MADIPNSELARVIDDLVALYKMSSRSGIAHEHYSSVLSYLYNSRPTIEEGVYEEIRAERARQDKKWGGAEHDDQEPRMAWVDYITRYVSWAGMMALMGGTKELTKYRRRMIQVAALAVAACEAHDRTAQSLEDSNA